MASLNKQQKRAKRAKSQSQANQYPRQKTRRTGR